jgi:hypothetical protein
MALDFMKFHTRGSVFREHNLPHDFLVFRLEVGEMQIHNFYSDPVPSVRNPLDSIVLSPHTIRFNDFSLADMEEASSDYQSLLPSISSCEYHEQDTCSQTELFSRCFRDIFCRFFKTRNLRKDKK